MIGYNEIIEAQNHIVEYWGEDGKNVISACLHVTPLNGDSKAFLEHCTACGGNWGGMLLTGIRRLWPDVYDAIPNDMGVCAFSCIMSTLILCGVDTSV